MTAPPFNPGPGVIEILGWFDPTGVLWIAPLGSPAPTPDSPPPAGWLPVKVERRADLGAIYWQAIDRPGTTGADPVPT